MLTRRSLLIGGAALCFPRQVFAQYEGGIPCKDGSDRLSFKGFQHCRLHPFYQQVVSRWGCYCGVGECRPTIFKAVPTSTEAPEGIIVMVAGEWFGVPKGKLHRDRDIPEELRVWDAHVCCTTEPPNPNITCVWINDVSA